MRPVSYASTAAWTRLRSASLARIRVTWVLTVPWLTNSVPAISAFGQPAGNQAQDIQLTLAEVAERALNCIARSGPGHVLLDNAAGDLRCEQGITGRNGADGRYQLFGGVRS